MKRTAVGKIFTVAALNVLALGIAPAANAHDKGCSNATLKGAFTHSATGFVGTPGSVISPFAAVSTITTTETALLRRLES